MTRDDAASPLSRHYPQFVLEAQQRPEDVGVEHVGITVRGLLDHEPRPTLRSSVVDGYVEPAVSGDGLIDQVVDFLVVAHIHLDEESFRAGFAQFGFERCAFCGTTARHDEARSCTSERKGGCTTDARQGTCDKDDGLIHLRLQSGTFTTHRLWRAAR